MTAAILAGGKGTRIGTNKAFLEIGGKPLIEILLEKVEGLFEEVLIIANSPHLYEYLNAKVSADMIPGRGSLGGIYTALRLASFPQAFCLACDMPFIEPGFIRYMMEVAAGYDVVIPKTADGLEPLHAIYSKACIPHIERLMQADDLKIIHFFTEMRVRVLEEEIDPFDPHGMLFFNINTHEDLKKARRHWQILVTNSIGGV